MTVPSLLTRTVQILQALLADNILFETKTLNAHWNVTGSHFNHRQEFFGDQYE